MNKFPETIPPENKHIIVYLTEGKYAFCVYKKVLTWKGYKLKFMNILSNAGFWFEDQEVEGWNRIPMRDENI